MEEKQKTMSDESDMYSGFELFRKFLKNRSRLTPLEIIKLNAMGIKFE